MGLLQLTPAQIQALLTTQYNSGASVPANTGAGSALGAVFNALTALSIALQQQISYENGISRLATSTGPDIDSFCTPFGVTRNPAVASQGTVVFGTPSPAGSQLLIANGTYVQTVNGTQFLVIADTSQPGYNSGLGGYVIPINGTSVNATVQAVIAGSAGNVAANTITQILSLPSAPAPAGVSTVNNALAFANGVDAETDTAYIARFQNTMQSRWATTPAVTAAVASAQNGITYTIGDMFDQFGNAKPNFFSVIVNALGQSGGPSQTLLNAVQTVVQTNRPIGVPYVITGPVLVSVAVSATLTLQSGAVSATVVSAAQTAVQGYLNNIGLSPTGAITTAQYAQMLVILKAVSGVANVTNLTMNGGTVDITAGFGSEIVSGALTFTTQ